MNSGLHAKVYIAGRSAALVTSANLSGGGLTNNVECGVVLQDREAVAALVEHFNLEWRRAAPVAEEDIVARARVGWKASPSSGPLIIGL